MIAPSAGGSRFLRWAPFAVSVLLILAVLGAYTANLVSWAESPDYGWRTIYNSGPNVVAEVWEEGESAGLRVGDRIRAINGIAYSTFDELFFRVRDPRPGSVNVYSVVRDGENLTISVPTGRLGFSKVIRRSGPFLVLGVIYALIGVLVFLMQPHAGESWLFLAMTSLLGTVIAYGAPSDLMQPRFLYDVRRLAEILLPAPIVHMALRFPKRRALLDRFPWVWAVPYLAGLGLFGIYKAVTPAFWSIPPALDLANSLYLLAALVVLLGSLAWNLFRDPSAVIRLQSRVILVGFFLGIFVPVLEMLLRLLLKVSLFPNPTVLYAFFVTVFPVSIGYTIVRHDLFAIDTIVRRTYGYVLSTAAIVGIYAAFVSAFNATFRSEEISRSPAFSIAFALGVFFAFRPLHARIQGFVDRLFYRQQYDYRKTIQSISEAMTTLFEPGQVQKMLVGSVVGEMSLEGGALLLCPPAGGDFEAGYVEGDLGESLAGRRVRADDPLIGILDKRSGPLFLYDLELEPAYRQQLVGLQGTFREFHAESMVPLKYKDVLRGVVALGRKKSGKIFTAEDVDLLKTVASQGAVSLENARLFQVSLQKSRMEEELKIAHDIQMSMLPERAPEVEGLRIAARSIPAREVGGDFYDFVAMDGEGAEGRVAVVVGDVSGKAVSGALVMAASRSVFRVLSEAGAPVGEVMNRMNSRLHRDVRKGMFVAALYVLLDVRGRTLTLSNAGQTSPILCPADGGPPILIENDGDRFPLGIIEDCSYEERCVPLNSGDVVILYTDGVVEAVNSVGEMYGFERFLETVGSGRHLSADALLERLLEDASRFAGGAEQHDDITVVVAKVQ